MKQQCFLTDQADFYRKMTNPSLSIVDWHILSEDMILLEFEYRQEFVPEKMTTNIVLASFTTAHARLRLYNVIHHLGEAVLYFDTDSVIYKSPDGTDLVPTGDYLGDLTDELGGHYIVEFVSGGPKNYAFKLENGDCFCKIKGFTLDHIASMRLNFGTMKEEVLLWSESGESTNTVVSYPNRIRRGPLKQKIFNRDENKKYRVVYTKRAIYENFDTKPYGY